MVLSHHRTYTASKGKKKVKLMTFLMICLIFIEGYDLDSRKTTLKIDLESIEVHDVESVRFKTTPHKVYKSRYEDWMERKEITDD